MQQVLELLQTLLGEDCPLAVHLPELVMRDDVGPFLQSLPNPADLQLDHGLLFARIALLEFLRLDVGLQLLLVLLHILVVLVVLPGLLEFAVLVGVDGQEQQLSEHVRPLLDFGEGGPAVVLHFEGIFVLELEVDFGQ